MNVQQLPGPAGHNHIFGTLNNLPIHWRDSKHNVTHCCEGSDVHPGVRLLWTLCGRDVPSNAAYLPVPPEADPVSCEACNVNRR